MNRSKIGKYELVLLGGSFISQALAFMFSAIAWVIMLFIYQLPFMAVWPTVSLLLGCAFCVQVAHDEVDNLYTAVLQAGVYGGLSILLATASFMWAELSPFEMTLIITGVGFYCISFIYTLHHHTK